MTTENPLSTLDYALYYASLGMAVLPLHHVRDDGTCSCGAATGKCKTGKHPFGPLVPHGVKEATTDQTLIRKWFTNTRHNIGIATGRVSGLFVLDSDDRADGPASLGALAPDDEPIDTLTQKTGGGHHYFFQIPAGVTIKNSSGTIGPGLDIRGEAGYVVAAPSNHLSGNTYHWNGVELPSRDDLGYAPMWLIDAIGVKPSTGTGQNEDMMAHDSHFTLPDDVNDGEGREETILKYASSLRAKGHAQAEIERLLLEYNRDHVHPPLDDDVVLDRARRYEKAQKAKTEKSPPHDQFEVLSKHRVAWDFSAPPPDRQFVFGSKGDGLFALGTSAVLAGVGSAGKGLIAYSCAVCVASGKAWGGLHVEPGAILVISLEDDPHECQRRLGAASERLQLGEQQLVRDRVRAISMPGIEFKLTSHVSGAYSQAVSNVDEVIREAKDLELCSGVPIKLIVVDHMRLALSGDANESEAATTMMSALTRIASETGAATVLLTHSPKSDLSKFKNNEKFDAASVLGSGAFSDNARFAAVVTKPLVHEVKQYGWSEVKAASIVVFRVVKSNYSSSDRDFYFERISDPQWGPYLEHVRPFAASPKSASTSLKSAIKAKIAQEPGRYTKRKLRGLGGAKGIFQASENKVTEALDDLLSLGEVLLAAPAQDVIDSGVIRARDQALWPTK